MLAEFHAIDVIAAMPEPTREFVLTETRRFPFPAKEGNQDIVLQSLVEFGQLL